MVEATLFWGYQAALFLGMVLVLVREWTLPADAVVVQREERSTAILWTGFGGLLTISVLVLTISRVPAPRLTLLVCDFFWAMLLFRSPWLRDRYLEFVRWLGAERS